MTDKTGVDRLKELAAQLHYMLDHDAHGGPNGCLVLSRVLVEIADFAGLGRVSAMPELVVACEAAAELLDAILGFHGQGLQVANWHQNGDLEPFDNFIDQNSDGTELDALREAIAKAKGK